MKGYVPDHTLIHHTSIDITNRVNISKPVSLVQYDSLPIIKVDLYYGHDRYTIPEGIDLVRLRMGRIPSQYYYKDILGWTPDKQSVYIQVEEDMTKDIGEFGLVIEFIEFDYESSKNKASPILNDYNYIGDGIYKIDIRGTPYYHYNIYENHWIFSTNNTESLLNEYFLPLDFLIRNEDQYMSSEVILGHNDDVYIQYRNTAGKNDALSFQGVINDTSYSSIGFRLLSGRPQNITKYVFKFQIEEGIEATEFEPSIKLMIAASSKVNVTVERNPVQEDHINKQETEVK